MSTEATDIFISAPDEKTREIVREQIARFMDERFPLLPIKIVAALRAPVAGADAGTVARCEPCDGTGDFQGGRRTMQKPKCKRCKGTGVAVPSTERDTVTGGGS